MGNPEPAATAKPPVCDMPVPHLDDLGPCGDRSRYRLERADHDEAYPVTEACPRHVPEALFDLTGGDEVQIIVTLHYDGDSS